MHSKKSWTISRDWLVYLDKSNIIRHEACSRIMKRIAVKMANQRKFDILKQWNYDQCASKNQFWFPGTKKLYKAKSRCIQIAINTWSWWQATGSPHLMSFFHGESIQGQVSPNCRQVPDTTTTFAPNWKSLHRPNVTIGRFCKIFRLKWSSVDTLQEVHGGLNQKGARVFCGVPVPDGWRKHSGSRRSSPYHQSGWRPWWRYYGGWTSFQGLIPLESNKLIKQYTYDLFRRGTEMALRKDWSGPIQNMNSGKHWWKDYLCDEIHTPDSSRYFYLEDMRAPGNWSAQRQLSKEFGARMALWLWFHGQEGQRFQRWVMHGSKKFQTGILNFTRYNRRKICQSRNNDILQRIEEMYYLSYFQVWTVNSQFNCHMLWFLQPTRIDQKIVDEVIDTLFQGGLTTGPKTKKFENCYLPMAVTRLLFVLVRHRLDLNWCFAGMEWKRATKLSFRHTPIRPLPMCCSLRC